MSNDDDPTSWVDLAHRVNELSIHDAASIASVASSSGSNAPPATPSTSVFGTAGTLGSGTHSPVRLALLEPQSNLCMRFVGTTNGRVCLRKKKDGEETCGTGHRGQGNLEVNEPLLVIKCGQYTAHSSPTLATSKLENSNVVSSLLDAKTLSTEQWAARFAVMNGSAEGADGAELERRIQYLDNPSPMSTPWKPKGGTKAAEDIIRPLLYHHSELVDSATHALMEKELPVKVASVISGLDTSVAKLSLELDRISQEANDYSVLAEHNREKMETLHLNLDGRVGPPVTIGGVTYPTMNEAIGRTAEMIEDRPGLDPRLVQQIHGLVGNASEVKRIGDDMDTFGGIVKALLGKMTELNDQVKALGTKVAERDGTTSHDPLKDLLGALPGHPARVEPIPPGIPDPGELATLKARIDVLEKKLEAHSWGEGVNMANIQLKTPQDLTAIIHRLLPRLNFGLFLDIHVMYELAQAAPLSATKMMESAKKLNAHGAREVRVIDSMQKTSPTILGGQMGTQPLSKLTSYKHWEDGTSACFKKQVEQSMTNIKGEFTAAIDQELRDSPSAALLAKECLTNTIQLATSIHQYLDSCYQQFTAAGYPAEPAWRLSRSVVHGLLRHVGEPRLLAMNPVANDPTTLASANLWGILRCQGRMKELSKGSLEDNAIVAGEISRFLVVNSSMAEIATLLKKLTKQETLVNALETRLKNTQSTVDKITTEFKDYKRKNPGK